ncbi:UvrD-helicase domain-containing protein [Thermophagus sp. OGC60D27]|uniref:UvrD-helicase domain-containing protein n=1 Tax=Thermophagus sp. OGC60D27 TaxID=3458415 RepID=UPI0040383BEC
MMPDINSLPHISTLSDIETHFKVFAGPGTGKTRWLISHLERVLRESDRLNRTGKIACITYTNVAAEEILNRLKCDKSRFDISTIHSFLYRNIVKPFSYLIEKKDDGEILFDTSRLDGHDEHIVHGDRFRRWIKSIEKLNDKKYTSYNWPQNKPKVIAELSSLDYVFDNGEINLIIRQYRGARIAKSNGELWVYKSKYWKDGIMHHEDVLYFSYLILCCSPRVAEFIRAKFPYIFIDEFQDTTEIQTWLIEKITEQHTIVGVVGDIAQSIYKFTGAKRDDFINFKRDGISEFKLNHNHRSTKRIIDFLNQLRPDINLEYGQGQPDGEAVKVLVGKIQDAKYWFEENFPDTPLYILTRKNTTVSEINNQIGLSNTNLLNEMYSNDTNPQRVRFLHSLLMSFKYHKKGDLKNALNEIYKSLRRVSGTSVLKLSLRRLAIKIIELLQIDANRNKPIADFYLELRTYVLAEYGFNIGSNLSRGNAKTFYENHSLNEIIPYVKVDTKSDELVRTIHSAKGTEFENTLVHFENIDDFRNYILDGPNHIDDEKDDCRIYYVGCSRAMNRLFINIPEINQDDKNKLELMNVEYKKV